MSPYEIYAKQKVGYARFNDVVVICMHYTYNVYVHYFHTVILIVLYCL